MDSIEKNMDNVEQEGQTILQRPTRRHRRRPEDDKYFKIRNILNIISVSYTHLTLPTKA